MSKEESKTKVFIDLDKGIEMHNKKYPDDKPLSRSNIKGVKKNTLLNWKNGKVPAALVAIIQFLEKAKCELSDITRIEK